MSELTMSAFAADVGMTTVDATLMCRQELERRRMAMPQARLKDNGWAAKDGWPKTNAALPSYKPAESGRSRP